MDFYWQNNIWILVIITLWVLPWKGYALWTAAKRANKLWFVVLLVLNTFSILEIFYVFYVAKKTPKEIKLACKNTLVDIKKFFSLSKKEASK